MCRARIRLERLALRCLACPASTSSFASTVSPSILYNGSRNGEIGHLMNSRTRRIVLGISLPVVVFAVLGGFLSKATAREETYQHLKVYEEVVQLISNQYVEKVDGNKVMLGALTGLA